jgi:sulfoxide reductase heme-binding subunit YedZ
MRKLLIGRWTKAGIFLACLLPLASLLWRGLDNGLTANPIEFVTHATGDWTLRFILFTLCVTPFRRLLDLPELIRFRRMFGLFAFFYGCLHFSTYIWLDKFFDLKEVWKDIAKRPYITVGFLAFVLLIPLAITSTAAWIRRLGGRSWQLLHRAIYISAVAGVIHYYWLVKSAVLRPLAYGATVVALLLWRLAAKFRSQPDAERGNPAKPQPQNSQA